MNLASNIAISGSVAAGASANSVTSSATTGFENYIIATVVSIMIIVVSLTIFELTR